MHPVGDDALRRASDRRRWLSEGYAPDEYAFAARLDRACDLLLGEAGKPGTNFKQVSPESRARMKGLLEHYAKKAHPFAACVRDNRKRFGPRTEAVCAVLKDLIRGTTKWRGHGNKNDKGSAGLKMSEDDVRMALMDDDVADALAMLADQPGRLADVLAVINDESDTEDAEL